MICVNCNKEFQINFGENPSKNYCSWNCTVEFLKQCGNKIIAPNNLPITCITADGTLMEDEHADHPDYKFPVESEFVGEKPKDLDESESYDYCNRIHALIYTDGHIALTLYEYTYSMWLLRDGHCNGGYWYTPKKEWKLTQESIDEINQYCKGTK